MLTGNLTILTSYEDNNKILDHKMICSNRKIYKAMISNINMKYLVKSSKKIAFYLDVHYNPYHLNYFTNKIPRPNLQK